MTLADMLKSFLTVNFSKNLVHIGEISLFLCYSFEYSYENNLFLLVRMVT